MRGERGYAVAKLTENRIRISVRNLVEFLLRSGDIDNRRKGKKETEAMAAGARLHRKIQSRMGLGYQAEVSLKADYEVEELVISLEGRADGLFVRDGIPTVDEIKGVYWNIEALEEPIQVHRAQAMCYACMALDCGRWSPEPPMVGIQLTYCHLESEEIRRFEERLSPEEIRRYAARLLEEYAAWGTFLYHHRQQRNASVKGLSFPFPYRPGQRNLAVSAYRAMAQKKTLFIQAPTGIGKTMSVLFPAVMAVGEGLGDKVFYLTAKTITRTVAEEAMEILRGTGLVMSSITLTAKEKLCPLTEEGKRPECNPEACPYAKGHFDRVNEAVFDYIHREEQAGRESILRWCRKYQVCPHEFSLDLSDWLDVVICDYNYVFDPNVQLKRYFGEGAEGEYLFLVDEAHNLVERAREMYSAVLYKEDFLRARALVKPYSKKLARRLSSCNKMLLEMKRESDKAMVREAVDAFALALAGAYGEMERFLEEFRALDGNEDFGSFYLAVRHFLNMYERLDESYCIYTEPVNEHSFLLRLYCVSPANNLSGCLSRGNSAIFFSATFLPIRYYKELICGNTEEMAVYVPSPFDQSKRLLAAAGDVSSRYKRRNRREYDRILDYILTAASGRKGNYLVYFPSYSYMEEVYQAALTRELAGGPEFLVQSPRMTEADREEFLEQFEKKRESSLVAFGVMGGIFSEGIDLQGERLIGVLVVGTGLPGICTEREILKGWYEKQGKDGFAYAYRYPGMNKVLQAAGRVIRTDTDEGIILLLDDRFLSGEYHRLFPREWADCHVINYEKLPALIDDFWRMAENRKSYLQMEKGVL
ncbi:MAG: ATP-dependent DNA helicase [Lachnospiraceae bacterium]|nr:ATP-dependent DNA helicase [Lachnospiraceae bacterium]